MPSHSGSGTLRPPCRRWICATSRARSRGDSSGTASGWTVCCSPPERRKRSSPGGRCCSSLPPIRGSTSRRSSTTSGSATRPHSRASPRAAQAGGHHREADHDGRAEPRSQRDPDRRVNRGRGVQGGAHPRRPPRAGPLFRSRDARQVQRRPGAGRPIQGGSRGALSPAGLVPPQAESGDEHRAVRADQGEAGAGAGDAVLRTGGAGSGTGRAGHVRAELHAHARGNHSERARRPPPRWT